MINIPEHCPSCNSKLDRVTNQLFCRNINCITKNSKVVEKYAKALKIKGLGPSSINKLQLQTVEEIYELDEDYLVEVLGVNGRKIYSEIQNKRSIPLGLFLGASSIPLVGITVANKITQDINCITKEGLMKDGVKDKASTNLIKWLNINRIPEQITFIEAAYKPELSGLKVCISGKIAGYTKASLATFLETYNVEVVNSVTKNIDYVINEDKPSAKTKKAQQLNIEIITLDDLKGKLNYDRNKTTSMDR